MGSSRLALPAVIDGSRSRVIQPKKATVRRTKTQADAHKAY